MDQTLTEHPELDVVQLQINYLDWDNESIQSRKCYEVARKHGKPVIVMEPIKGGTLMKLPEEAKALFAQMDPQASLASWALRFAASHEGVMMVLSGMNSLEQMRDNLSFMKDFVPMTEAEKATCAEAAVIIQQSSMIPCTACHHCTETCPKHIPIPEYLVCFRKDIRQPRSIIILTWHRHMDEPVTVSDVISAKDIAHSTSRSRII